MDELRPDDNISLPQPGSIPDVQRYRELVLMYESLSTLIDRLVEGAERRAGQMSMLNLQLYRKLAFRRDEVFNDMRVLEQKLLADDYHD